MKQLSGIDNYFLDAEHGNVFNHVALLAIYDPSTSANGKVRFKEILKHFADRLHMHPIFRRKLVTVPGGIDRPYWIDVDEIDVEFHIRHIALPEPGDWRQLMIQVARLHSRPLDRSRPLWEIYVIEGLERIQGLPSGSFALFTKFHHASVDGMAGAALLGAVHSLSPSLETEQVAPPPQVVDREPSTLELYTRTMVNNANRMIGLTKFYWDASAKVSAITVNAMMAKSSLPIISEAAEKAPSMSFVKAPKTRFSGRVSANRAVDAVGLPLSDIREIRNLIPDVTLNDIFVSVCGGALRTYLEKAGELPETSMRALMPINIRAAGAAAALKGGNEVGGAPIPLRTDIADPIERLHAVHSDVADAKGGAEVLGTDTIKSIYEVFPFSVSNFIIENFMISQVNCTVSNVRGPDIPLFVAGARMVHACPVSIPVNGAGLNFTGFSYNGVMWICITACRNMLPDPSNMSAALQKAFDDLKAAARASAEKQHVIPEKTPVAPKPKKPAKPKVAKPAKSAKPAPAPAPAVEKPARKPRAKKAAA